MPLLPSTFSQQAPNQTVDVEIKREKNGIKDSLLKKTAQVCLPKFPQHQRLLPPEYTLGQMISIPPPRFPQRQRTSPPEFSIVENKACRPKEHDEAHSISVTASEEMEVIRALCEKYHKDDIYNMDETRLHWKHVLHATLAPNTSLMTLLLCVNSTGSDRLPIWIMGSEKEPVSFHELDPEMAGAVWLPTENQSMIHTVMEKWLLYFYSHVGNERSVVLLLDNLGAHRKGVELTPPPSNIRIQWLPPRSTSRYQPLDLGIIGTLRSHYQKIWLKNMIPKIYGDFVNPVPTMPPELAVCWILQVWKHHIANTTIHDCFCKSSVIQHQHPFLTSGDMLHTSLLYQKTQQRSVAGVYELETLF